MSLEDLVKASQRMTEKDFPQFDDPRVREVMAAAANLVEGIISGVFSQDDENESIYALKMALFAAQHSQSKLDGPEPQLANFCKGCGHIAWLVHLKDGLCLDCQEVAQHSKPKNECANCGSYRPAVGNGDLCQECLEDVGEP